MQHSSSSSSSSSSSREQASSIRSSMGRVGQGVENTGCRCVDVRGGGKGELYVGLPSSTTRAALCKYAFSISNEDFLYQIKNEAFAHNAGFSREWPAGLAIGCSTSSITRRAVLPWYLAQRLVVLSIRMTQVNSHHMSPGCTTGPAPPSSQPCFCFTVPHTLCWSPSQRQRSPFRWVLVGLQC